MVKPRVQETDSGITGEFTCEVYDELQRGFRDRGWLRTKDIVKAGMTSGHALEIGPGPGYLGLEWLKSTEGTTLTGLEISAVYGDILPPSVHYGPDCHQEIIVIRGRTPDENLVPLIAAGSPRAAEGSAADSAQR